MLAKDDSLSVIVYMFVIVIVFFFQKKKRKKKKKQKKTRASAWVKNSKARPQLPHYLSFLLGKGGKPLYLKPY